MNERHTKKQNQTKTRNHKYDHSIQALKWDNVYPIVCAPDKHPQGMCTFRSCVHAGVFYVSLFHQWLHET